MQDEAPPPRRAPVPDRRARWLRDRWIAAAFAVGFGALLALPLVSPVAQGFGPVSAPLQGTMFERRSVTIDRLPAQGSVSLPFMCNGSPPAPWESDFAYGSVTFRFLGSICRANSAEVVITEYWGGQYRLALSGSGINGNESRWSSPDDLSGLTYSGGYSVLLELPALELACEMPNGPGEALFGASAVLFEVSLFWSIRIARRGPPPTPA